jgi:hypothetical protein
MTMTNDATVTKAATKAATKAPATKAATKAAATTKATPKGKGGAKAAPAKAAKGKATVAKVAKMLYRPEQRIIVITKENPRRDGKGPSKRYNTLTACKTVGEFLAKLPKWQSTITRNVNEGHVKLAG